MHGYINESDTFFPSAFFALVFSVLQVYVVDAEIHMNASSLRYLVDTLYHMSLNESVAVE
jgi:hypothetical protein